MKKVNVRSHLSCVYELQYHIVFVTKYRKRCINCDIMEFLRNALSHTLMRWDCELLEFNGEADHIHMLIKSHPALELSKLINNLKTVSSRMVRQRWPEYLKEYYWQPVFWTRAYFVSSCGDTTIDNIRAYIEKQGS